MARTSIPIAVIDRTTGEAVSGASVTVRHRADNSTATVYSGETGGTTTANPLATDANGRVAGWVERGAYKLSVSGAGIIAYDQVFDAAPASDDSIDNEWLAATAGLRVVHFARAKSVTALTGGKYQWDIVVPEPGTLYILASLVVVPIGSPIRTLVGLVSSWPTEGSGFEDTAMGSIPSASTTEPVTVVESDSEVVDAGTHTARIKVTNATFTLGAGQTAGPFTTIALLDPS